VHSKNAKTGSATSSSLDEVSKHRKCFHSCEWSTCNFFTFYFHCGDERCERPNWSLDTIICNCLIFTLLKDAVTTVEVTHRWMKWTRMVSRWKIWKKGRSCLASRYHPSIRLQKLRRFTKNLRQERRYSPNEICIGYLSVTKLERYWYTMLEDLKHRKRLEI
jgi:hypothetical protein